MKLLSLALGAACATAAATAVLAPTAAFADTAPAAAGVFNTKVANVHVRSLPKSMPGSKLVTTIAAAGSPVSLVCYVTTPEHKTWYRTSNPDGYVAGRNLVLPHTPGQGRIAPNVPACAS